MKTRKSSITCRSFQDLKNLLESKSISLPDRASLGGQTEKGGVDSKVEESLFRKAMEGVKPLSKEKVVGRAVRIEPPRTALSNEDADALERLRNLLRHGTGFNVSDTPEYIEGTGYHVSPSIAKRLHRGDFSIQAHVDLHGLRVEDAKVAFEEFLDWAVTTGKRGVLIVHGRGLSSPSEPILKNKVKEWLTRGPWRKWVVAYCSARKCDGGAGATYVLLRLRPVSKRVKVRRRERPGN